MYKELSTCVKRLFLEVDTLTTFRAFYLIITDFFA